MQTVLIGFHPAIAVKWKSSNTNEFNWKLVFGVLNIWSGGDIMSDAEIKPLNWNADSDIGYTVERRSDGGMQYTFMDVSHATLEHWRRFSMDHLIESDRLTRNLYDLRQIEELPEEAIIYALEVSNDPAARNIRLAVVLANEQVRESVEKIAALTPPGGLRIGIFTSMDEAETWLIRPLTQVV
jgi:hypothetical protein